MIKPGTSGYLSSGSQSTLPFKRLLENTSGVNAGQKASGTIRKNGTQNTYTRLLDIIPALMNVKPHK